MTPTDNTTAFATNIQASKLLMNGFEQEARELLSTLTPYQLGESRQSCINILKSRKSRYLTDIQKISLKNKISLIDSLI